MGRVRIALLLTSLALNGILGIVFALGGGPDTSPQQTTKTQARSSSRSRTRFASARGTSHECPWTRLRSTSFQDFAASLRFAGCPEEMVRNLVTGAINRQFQARKAQLKKITDCWLDGEEKAAEEKARAAGLVSLEAERQALISQCLQIPWYKAPWLDDATEISAYFLGFLDPQTARRTTELYLQAYVEACAAKALGDLETPQGLQRLRDLASDLNARLGTFLSSYELDEMGIRMFEVSYFDVWGEERRFGTKLSGAELREVLRILKPDVPTAFDLPDDLQHAHWNSLETGRQLRAALGDDRFAVFLQHHWGDLHKTPGWTDAEKPAPEVYLQLFELRESVERDLEVVRTEPGTDTEARARATAGVLQAARETASKLMAPQVFTEYLHGGGAWLQALEGPNAP